jgi:hypothetical protein
MATNVVSVNIYAINGQTFRSTSPQRFGFPVQSSVFREVEGTVLAADGTTRLYGIVQPIPTGLNVSQPQFYTVETVTQLVALANA